MADKINNYMEITMHYCPHCSEALPKSVQVCPRCKKTVDFAILATQFENHETSYKDKKA